jgi:hypothetical protein
MLSAPLAMTKTLFSDAATSNSISIQSFCYIERPIKQIVSI